MRTNPLQFTTLLIFALLPSLSWAGSVQLTAGESYTTDDGTLITCAAGDAQAGVVMAVQGYDFGPTHPHSAINMLRASCDGTLSQVQCRKIEENEFKDTMCFGLCKIR